MQLTGRAVLERVGGEILTPRSDGGAYDEMLRALHAVVIAHRASSSHDSYAMYLRDLYRDVSDRVEGARPGSYADLLDLRWDRTDYRAMGGAFNTVEVWGLDPLYQVGIDMLAGRARVVDHERGTRQRVGQAALVGMTRGFVADDWGNLPDHRYLSRGYVVVPYVDQVDIRSEGGEVTGDSVRRAMDPYEDQLAAIAASLLLEAQRSA